MFNYGVAHHQKIKYTAHCLFYEIFVSLVPNGMVIDHLCRNTLCVNPTHLEAVTQQLNVLRGEGGAALNMKKTHCPQGHPLSGSNLTKSGLSQGRRACRICKNERANIPSKHLLPPKKELDVLTFQEQQQTDRLPTSTYLLARIFNKITQTDEITYNGDRCWQWNGCIPKSGYGQVFFRHPLSGRAPRNLSCPSDDV